MGKQRVRSYTVWMVLFVSALAVWGAQAAKAAHQPIASITSVATPYTTWRNPTTGLLEANPDGPYIYEGWFVTMEATAVDPAGYLLIYQWTQTSGQPERLTGSTCLAASLLIEFASLTSTSSRIMTFQFVATDNCTPPMQSHPVSTAMMCYLCGDIDHDNTVILADLKLLVAAWNSLPSSGNWNPAADLDDTGSSNLGDLKLLIANWNRSLN